MTDRRVHIALAVADLERSSAFYETLLGGPPSKRRPGYAKFEPEDPALNLTLNQSGPVAGGGSSAAHFGIQVKSSSAVLEASQRFARAGLATTHEEGTTCCYAVQDKVWVTDPDGHAWEVFVVTQADADRPRDSTSTCCVPVMSTEPTGGPAER